MSETVNYVLLLIPIISLLIAVVFFTVLSLFIYTLCTKNKPTRFQIVMTAVSVIIGIIVYSLFVPPLDQLTVIIVPLYLAIGVLAAFVSTKFVR